MNITYRKVGGLRFLKLGRLTLSWSIARKYRPVKGTKAHLAERSA